MLLRVIIMSDSYKLNYKNMNQEQKLFSKLNSNLSYKSVNVHPESKQYFSKSKITICYSEDDDSFWFSRIRVKDSYLYYFGLNLHEIKPHCIIKFDEHESFSGMIFSNNLVKIRIKVKDNNPDVLNRLKEEFMLEDTTRRLKMQGFYYVVLGNINKYSILDNFKKFIKSFVFNVSNKTRELTISDIYDDNVDDVFETISNDMQQENESESNVNLNNDNSLDKDLDSLNLIKTNLDILNLVKYIQNATFEDGLKNSIVDYLFSFNKNYQFNIGLFKKQSSNKDLIRIIKNTIDELNDYDGLKVNLGFKMFREKLNDKINDYYLDIENPTIMSELNDIFIEKPMKINSNTSEEGISKNDDNIILNESQSRLFNEYLELIPDSFVLSYLIPDFDASEYDVNKIFENIKVDISKEIISEDDDIDDVVEQYFEDYFNNSNSNIMIEYLDLLMDNNLLIHDLREKYGNIKDSDIEDIKFKLNLDIKNLNLDKNGLKYRFELYFEKKSFEIQYRIDLNEKHENIDKYLQYGLTSEDIEKIFSTIGHKIENWHDDWSIFDKPLSETIEFEINNKLNETRNETRSKFETIFPNKRIIRNILINYNYSDEYYDDLIKLIYKDIYLLEIKSNDIDEKLIIAYFSRLSSEGGNYDY